jgi:hypothetical protein
MSDQQQTFEDAVNQVVRAGQGAAVDTFEAARLALALGDQMAFGVLHAYGAVVVELFDLISREKDAVHARLSETLPTEGG